MALRIGFGDDDLSYAIDFGLPQRGHESMFSRDPEIKYEVVWAGPVPRPSGLLSRRAGSAVMVRQDGRWIDTGRRLARQDSMLAEVADIDSAPEILAVRNRVRNWRFYDSFRTDPDAPARGLRPGTFTPVMADNGEDLASALQTLRELGHGDDLDAAVTGAFPGSRVEIADQDGLFRVRLQQPGMLRPLDAAELSDGTLRFLLWVAALLIRRPPELFVLNEPETSLHPALQEPLAELVTKAAARTQVVVVTDSADLRELLATAAGASRRPDRASSQQVAADSVRCGQPDLCSRTYARRRLDRIQTSHNLAVHTSVSNATKQQAARRRLRSHSLISSDILVGGSARRG